MGSILTGVTFCYWTFWFSRSKASDVNTGIIAILGVSKNLYWAWWTSSFLDLGTALYGMKKFKLQLLKWLNQEIDTIDETILPVKGTVTTDNVKTLMETGTLTLTCKLFLCERCNTIEARINGRQNTGGTSDNKPSFQIKISNFPSAKRACCVQN